MSVLAEFQIFIFWSSSHHKWYMKPRHRCVFDFSWNRLLYVLQSTSTYLHIYLIFGNHGRGYKFLKVNLEEELIFVWNHERREYQATTDIFTSYYEEEGMKKKAEKHFCFFEIPSSWPECIGRTHKNCN